MNNNLVSNNSYTTGDEILKLTALLYIEDALTNEQFEDCRELIKSAKELGARSSEIRQVLLGYIRRIRLGPSRTSEVDRKSRTQRRLE